MKCEMLRIYLWFNTDLKFILSSENPNSLLANHWLHSWEAMIMQWLSHPATNLRLYVLDSTSLLLSKSSTDSDSEREDLTIVNKKYVLK